MGQTCFLMQSFQIKSECPVTSGEDHELKYAKIIVFFVLLIHQTIMEIVPYLVGVFAPWFLTMYV